MFYVLLFPQAVTLPAHLGVTIRHQPPLKAAGAVGLAQAATNSPIQLVPISSASARPGLIQPAR